MNNSSLCSEADSAAGILVYVDFSERQILAAILVTGAILGTVGNSFVILAVALSKKLRTATNVFVVNLAVADVLTCVFMPWQAVAILGADNWPLPDARWVCTAASFIIVVTIGCSVNNLALIAINRWVGITKSRSTTRRIYTARKLGLMVIFSWGIPFCLALIPVVTDYGELGYEKLYRACTWMRSNRYTYTYNMVLASLYYPIQLILIIVSYTSLFRYVRETSRKTVQAAGENEATRRKLWKRQLAVTKNLVYVVLAFMLCFTPYFISLVIYADWSYRLVPWGAAILFCNSCVNPLIYATSHPDFKDAGRHLIRCQKILKGSPRKRYNSTTNTPSSAVDHGHPEVVSQMV